MRDVTVCFLLKKDEICLAMKKRGFGEGKWNGVGGKVDAGETIREAAVRELNEEICVQADAAAIEEVGTIDFHFNSKEEWNQRMHIFFVYEWEGEPTETDEMAPQWFARTDIPYEKMWVDDIEWLPKALEGKKLEGSCYLCEDGGTMERFDLQEVLA